jgi:hypothetical protein
MNRAAFLVVIAIQASIPVASFAQGSLNNSEAVERRVTELRESFVGDAKRRQDPAALSPAKLPPA